MASNAFKEGVRAYIECCGYSNPYKVVAKGAHGTLKVLLERAKQDWELGYKSAGNKNKLKLALSKARAKRNRVQ